MKVTAITSQQKNPSRINVMIDGVYRFSLDISQVVTLGVKVGADFSEEQLQQIEGESEFGKLYSRALEYCLMRPHSAQEIREYLWRKTRATKYRSRRSGEVREREGVSQEVADRVYERLLQRGYIDDKKFARHWVESRNVGKGSSLRKLTAELRAKGVSDEIIAQTIEGSDRSDVQELHKMIAKKRNRYDDPRKFTQYLLRQGFRYDDIRHALES